MGDEMRRDEPGDWSAPGAGSTPRLAALHNALSALGASSLVGCSDAEVADDLCALTRLHAQLTSQLLRYAAEADRREVGEESGATSTAAWWAHTTKLTRPETNRMVTLARALDAPERVSTAEAFAGGGVLTDQVHVITQAVAAVPAELGEEVRGQAEAFLLDAATDHDAKALRVLGRRILDIVAPEVSDAHEERLLLAEERAADAAVRLTMTDDGQGRTFGRFTLPTAQAHMLRQHLLALANPRRHPSAKDLAGSEESERQLLRPMPERLGRAFLEYIERYPTDHTPDAGGVAARVVVTMSLDTLLGRLGSAHLDTGAVISASQARRMACEAGIIPAVLGGKSQVLDLGRTKRFHSTAQRIALNIRDGGCTTVGCERPPGGCHAHHDLQWSQGGPTTVDKGRLLCARHHQLAHNPAYDMKILGNNLVEFHRRT